MLAPTSDDLALRVHLIPSNSHRKDLNALENVHSLLGLKPRLKNAVTLLYFKLCCYKFNLGDINTLIRITMVKLLSILIQL